MEEFGLVLYDIRIYRGENLINEWKRNLWLLSLCISSSCVGMSHRIIITTSCELRLTWRRREAILHIWWAQRGLLGPTGIFSSSIYHSLAFSSTKIYGPDPSGCVQQPSSLLVLHSRIEENISWLQSGNNKSLIYILSFTFNVKHAFKEGPEKLSNITPWHDTRTLRICLRENTHW